MIWKDLTGYNKTPILLKIVGGLEKVADKIDSIGDNPVLVYEQRNWFGNVLDSGKKLIGYDLM